MAIKLICLLIAVAIAELVVSSEVIESDECAIIESTNCTECACAGLPGRDGRDGITVHGPPGRDGRDGRDGKDCVECKQGPKGSKGDKGDKGSTGKKGEKGIKGDSGNKGVKGDTGDKGSKGERGVRGENGSCDQSELTKQIKKQMEILKKEEEAATKTKIENLEKQMAELSKKMTTFTCANTKVITDRIIMGKTSFGDWTTAIMCSTRVAGFRLRVEGSKGDGDDTALNGIQLKCSDGSVTEQIVGHWGDWKGWKTCAGTAFVDGFNFRSEGFQGAGDDTAGNDVKMRCTDGVELEGDGMSWGSWEVDGFKECAKGQFLCGVRAMIEPGRGAAIDDTSLNKMEYICCNCKPM